MFETRLNTAIFSKLEGALVLLAEELTDTSVVGFDPLALQPQVAKRLHDFFKEPDEETYNQALLQLGQDQATSPQALANALVWNEVAEILGEMQKLVESMSKKEIGKLIKWTKMNCGSSRSLEWDTLLISEQEDVEPNEHLAKDVLNASRQVMDENLHKLRQIIQSIPDNESGIKGFYRDLALARLHNDQTDALIRDIMNVDDLGIIEDIITELSARDIPREESLVFLAIQVRTNLMLRAAETKDGMEDREEH